MSSLRPSDLPITRPTDLIRQWVATTFQICHGAPLFTPVLVCFQRQINDLRQYLGTCPVYSVRDVPGLHPPPPAPLCSPNSTQGHPSHPRTGRGSPNLSALWIPSTRGPRHARSSRGGVERHPIHPRIGRGLQCGFCFLAECRLLNARFSKIKHRPTPEG